MLSKNELDVLVSLFPEKNFKTIREIQKNGNYSYERTYSALWSLRDKKNSRPKEIWKCNRCNSQL